MYIIVILILLYCPIFSGGMQAYVVVLIVTLFHMVYEVGDKSAISYFKLGCFYATFLSIVTLILGLYQIIFGDPTNWLGTGFDLTTLPKI